MASLKKDRFEKVLEKMKTVGWIVSIALAIVIGGLVFTHFSSDYNLYLVRSESMKPAINMGNMVVIGPLNGEVKPGMIVTYERGKELVTHRVLSVNGDTLVTKGDAMEEADPWTVTLSDVKGAYLFQIPYVGYVSNFVRTKLGWFLLIITPAALLVALLIKGIIKEALRENVETGEPAWKVVRATNDTAKTWTRVPQEAVSRAGGIGRPVVEAPKVSIRVSEEALSRTKDTSKVAKKVFEESTREFEEWLNGVGEISKSEKGGIPSYS